MKTIETLNKLSPKELTQYNLDYTLFSWSKQGGLNPLFIESAKGVYLYDGDGNRILDFSSQLMNMNIGHGRPEVAAAVAAQMAKCSFVAPNMATEPRGLLGKKLAEVTPGDMSKTFFTLGGAEAIENAIKLARAYTGKHKIITQYRSYHGGTYAAMTAGGDPRKHTVDAQQVPNIVHVENPYSYRCPWYSASPEECGERAIKNLEQVILYENPNTIAAIMMEGESGSSGCFKYPPFYLKQVRALCDKYNILMIDDEVMSGFGRTGKYFAINHHDVTPDIMCVAKGLTCGYLPLGAVIVRPHIAAAFEDKVLPLGLTYSAHATSCAAALAVLDIYEQDNLVENAAAMGHYVDGLAAEMKAKHPSIGDWRNTGLLGCFELVKNKKTKEPMCEFNSASDAMNKVAAKIRELGMFTFVRWNYVFVAPPLCVTKDQIEEGMGIISKAIEIADKETN